MNRLFQILALTLVALLVPAAVCCLVPQASENQPRECCSIPDRDHDVPVQQDACPSTTIAHSQLPVLVSMPEMQMIELCDIISAASRIRELTAQATSSTIFPATMPPESQTTWVFVSRAALPARAPSELA